MDDRVAGQQDPRSTGKALTGPLLGAFWRYRVDPNSSAGRHIAIRARRRTATAHVLWSVGWDVKFDAI